MVANAITGERHTEKAFVGKPWNGGRHTARGGDAGDAMVEIGAC